jgi:ABC-type sugar transport system ATPase subunit
MGQAGGCELKQVSKRFGPVVALEGLSFRAAPGEFCVLLGPSGCGKSTALRVLAGLEEPDSGEVLIGGRLVNGLEPRERDVAMVFQSYALYPHLSAFDNMAFSLRLRGLPREEVRRRVERTARLLAIEPLLARLPAELSGGERQRVAMGRALVREPRLFLFDEPLSNLDAPLRLSMRVELARLHRQLGATMVYVTHDQAEAMSLATRIVLLERGRLSQEGSPQDLYERPANLFAARFIGSPPMNLIEGELVRRAGRLNFVAAGCELGLPPGLPEPPNARVILGVRPEDIHILGAGEAEQPAVFARVEAVEDLGSEGYAYLRAGEQRLVARLERQVRLAEGALVGIRLARLHLFAAGRRVGGSSTSG